MDGDVALNCWVPFILKKREVKMSLVKSRVRKITYKHRIEVSTSLKLASKTESVTKSTFLKKYHS